MLRLITIPISHYCEKARWALDRAGQRYVEEPYLPPFHRPAVRRAAGHRTVPVLVTPEGSVIESTPILRWVDVRLAPERRLFADDPRLERWLAELDTEFGVDTRLWAYAQILPHESLTLQYATARGPRWQARMAALAFPLLRVALTKHHRITPASIAHAEQRIDRLLDRVDALLEDGRSYLLGDRFTAVDLTFAALAAPLVSPAEYHVPLPPPEAWPQEAAPRVRGWRERPSGQLVLRLYREQRKR